ncbi:peptidase [Oleomonas cavernae]|uniref:Peptidase n=1 Tax=Oleomonas cavernae TaxID=2320859 RepID=A0A418WU95_9PROT|nr:peptidase [Oleomonas cavernae]RJF94811.1 peptidase [Oleomonas cavernae]
MKPFQIFRAGTHTSNEGVTLEYAEGDLAVIADAYDPANHQAPICVGHPKTDAPAYGWIGGLAVDGDRLVATPTDIDPAFADLVKAKRFKTISAAFYTPTSPNNPTPGGWYLRHVAFLGAAAPAVKGLKPVEFAAGGDGVVTIEFSDWSTSATAGTAARLFRRLRDWMIGKEGLAKADEILSEWEIQSLTETAVEARPDPSPLYTDPTKEPDMTAANAAELERRAAELAAKEAKFATDQAQFADSQAKARAEEDAAFVTSVVAAGRLPIGMQATATALFSQLDDGTLSFADGGETKASTGRQAFRDLLAGLPLPVVTKEIAGGKAHSVDFADPVAIAGAINTEIEDAKKKGETISPADALDRLKQKGA